jgi:hypothetical protein
MYVSCFVCSYQEISTNFLCLKMFLSFFVVARQISCASQKNLKLNEDSPKVGFRRTCCSTKIGAKTLQSNVIDHGIFDSASAWLLRYTCISVNSCDQMCVLY